MNLPILTESLVLRPLRDSDLGEFLAYRNDPKVARFQYWETTSVDEAVVFLRENTGAPGRWHQIGVALGSTDCLIGDIGICLRDDGCSAELGFSFASPYQGRGLAREAMTGLINALFDQPGLERLEAVTDTRNAAAMALLARLGFRIRSTAEVPFKGALCQEHTYALDRAAWQAA